MAALACGQMTAVAADDRLPARICGIRVVAFTPDPVSNERAPVNRPWSFNSPFQPISQGTHIDILIPSPGGGFVGDESRIDPKIGKVIKVVDSLGKDLTTARVHQFMGKPWSIEALITEVQTSNDGSNAMVTLFVPQTPTPGAGSIDLSAELTLKHCPKVQELKASGVSIRSPGTSFQLGQLTLKVNKPHSFDYQGRKLTYLKLESTDACTALQKIELQKDGKTLRTLSVQLDRSKGKERLNEFSCNLEGLPDQVDVVASLYLDHDKPETLTIPITVSTGLGLTAGENGAATISSVGPADPLVTVAGFKIGDTTSSRLMPDSVIRDGTTIALTIVRATGGIIKLDPAKCKISKATDSKGKDLAAPRADDRYPGRPVPPRFGGSSVAIEGTSAGIEIQLPQAPSPGSRSVHFTASIALLCCDETVEFKASSMDLTKAGSKFEAGPFRFEVTRPEATGEQDQRQPCTLRIRSKQDLDQIKQITLKVGDQTSVAEGGPSGLTAGEFDASYSIPGLAKLPASADVVVTVYKDLKNPKTVMVPVEGTIGLGLPPQR
jgi:hypothetical protein